MIVEATDNVLLRSVVFEIRTGRTRKPSLEKCSSDECFRDLLQMTEFTEWTKPCKAYDTIKGTSLTLSDVCEILYRKDAKFRNLLFGTRIRKVTARISAIR